MEKEATLYTGPANWSLKSVDGYRDRKFIRLRDRNPDFESDFQILERSVLRLLHGQRPDGCFMTEHELSQYDKTDDQIGAAGMLAYYLTLTPPDAEKVDALERAVRFQMEQLVWTKPALQGRYLRAVKDRDTSSDWCATLWGLTSANAVLRHGRDFLSPETYAALWIFAGDLWTYLQAFPLRNENPCHNQLVEYCAIGYAYAKLVGLADVQQEILGYYREKIRTLRVPNRGRMIYSEFNRWCAHYSLLSWMALEEFSIESGDPLVEEDAMEMAAAFNDRLSAGGYTFGGSRRDEGGYEEFLLPLWLRQKAFDFGRLLLSEPSTQWQKLSFDGHCGRVLVGRMPEYAKERRHLLPPRPASEFTLRRKTISVHLDDLGRVHHLSVNGLEILQANSQPQQDLTWLKEGVRTTDWILQSPPPPSQGQSYLRTSAGHEAGVSTLASMRRGSSVEIRQWWIASDTELLWFIHLLAHSDLRVDELRFSLGNPYLSCFSGQPAPLAEVANTKTSVKTYGPAQRLHGDPYLQLGDQFLTATHPLCFERPSETAFNGFPAKDGVLWREITESNRLDLILLDSRTPLLSRESLFAAVRISANTAAPKVLSKPHEWECRTATGTFQAVETAGVWNYRFLLSAAGKQETHCLPDIGFGLR